MKTITISEKTYESIKGQLGASERVDISELDDFVGKAFFIRTVTYHIVGKIESFVGGLIELSGASWVADSGRFMGAIKEGTLKEVEPVGQAFVNLGAVVDMFPWKHSLPMEQK